MRDTIIVAITSGLSVGGFAWLLGYHRGWMTGFDACSAIWRRPSDIKLVDIRKRAEEWRAALATARRESEAARQAFPAAGEVGRNLENMAWATDFAGLPVEPKEPR